LGIAIGLVIMGIFMAAAVPAWEYVIQREREEELLWRGRQYVQAIRRYQQKYPGAFPANIDVLVEEKFLRKAYKDPMNRGEDGESDWRILRQNSPEIRGLTTPEQPQSRDIRFRQQGFNQPRQLGRQSRFGMSEEQLGGIVGVASSSDKTTLRVPGRKEAEFLRTVGEAEKYNEWLFVFQVGADPTRQPPGAPGAPGAPPGFRRRAPEQPGQGGPRGFNTPNRPNQQNQQNRQGAPNPPGARRP